ncbi:neutrophil collagenase [Amia ocellicauda]|uniref:neutrophil collagenase n=1 Tax=Amia ocellicauda TaxID=2972642 RepID=UPI003464BBD3
MKTIWLCVCVLTQPFLMLAFPLQSPLSEEQDLKFAEVYLKKYYGFKPLRGRQRRVAEQEGFQEKVKDMQRFFSLPENGHLTEDTLATMRRPRCGLSDAETFGSYMKWRNTNLTYRIENYTSALTPPQVRRVFRRAWRLWTDVTPLRFCRKAKREADVMISFQLGDHGDNSPFDGSGGILAHAFHPGTGQGGDVHFDGGETWSVNSTGYNLFSVAVHEFGHALGLQHSSDPGAAMFPAYNYIKPRDFELSYQDVQRIQEIYGAHPNYSTKALKRPPPKTPDKCDSGLAFDAVTRMQDEVVFLKDRFLWRRHPQLVETAISLISSLWIAIPSYVDAAYENVAKDFILIFKDTQYWGLRRVETLQGFPKSISDFGFPPSVRSIDAALHFRSAQQTLFFTGKAYWRYNEKEERMEFGYPKPIAQDWPGIVPPVDAAVMYEDLAYFFCGHLQYQYDPVHKYVIQTRPANEWLQC